MIQTKTEKLWLELEHNSEHSSGLEMKRYSPDSFADAFVSIRLPEKIVGIAFKFSNSAEIDLNMFDGLKEIKAELFPNQNEHSKTLVLSLIEDDLREIYAVLSEDLFNYISKSISEKEILSTLIYRFGGWRDLFSNSGTNILSIDKLTGLFGELYMLKNLVLALKNKRDIINSWLGPERGIRDFEVNNWAVEVKTSRTNNPQKIKINSERQLDASLIEYLFLFHLSVEIQNSTEYSINDLIIEIKDLLIDNSVSLIRFEAKLLNAGYYKNHQEKYANYTFKIRDEKFYRVINDFPRIEEKDIPDGTGEINYAILISSIPSDYLSDIKTVIDKFPLQ